MTKKMRMTFGPVRLFPQTGDNQSKSCLVQRTAIGFKKEGCLRVTRVIPVDQISPQGIARGLAEVDGAPFATFGPTRCTMLDHHATDFLVHVANCKRGQLRSA